MIVFAKYKKWYRQNSTKALKFVGQNGTLFKSKGNILPQNVSLKKDGLEENISLKEGIILKKIDILYHFNEKYAPFAGTSITSLLENNKHLDEITLYIMGEALSDESIHKFIKLVVDYNRNIVFLDTEKLIELMKKINIPDYRGSYAANMRLFIADILPETVKRLLYLDSDTVVEGKLDRVIDLDMKEYPLAMTVDSLGFAHKRELNITGNYYNSGTIIFQMDIWRKEMFTYKIIDHIRNVRSHYPMPDQDLLNVLCQGKILTLGPEFNLQPIHVVFPWKVYKRVYGKNEYYSEEMIDEAVKNPIVCHFFRFCGEFPWNKNNVHPDSEIFDYYLGLSPWRSYRKEPAKIGLAFQIEKLMYRYLPKEIFIFAFEMAHKKMVHKANKISLKNEIYRKF